MKHLPATIPARETKAPLVSLAAAGPGARVAKPAIPPPGTAPFLHLHENFQRPTVRLFEARDAAEARARQLGSPWCAVAFACGYILTNGWDFQDSKGPLPAFCPVPAESLPFMQQLVTDLKRENVTGKEAARRIYEELKTIPALLELSQPRFEAACTATLLRIGYSVPRGAKDDWLTMPAWALRLPSRRKRLA
jgi:hypothetical protein